VIAPLPIYIASAEASSATAQPIIIEGGATTW
jgi:hypothetical protein